MLPSESREPAEVRISRHDGAAMLYGNRRVLGVGDQLSGGSRPTAQSFQDVQVIRTGAYYARRRAFHQRGDESKGLVEGGWRVKDAGIGHDADEARQHQQG